MRPTFAEINCSNLKYNFLNIKKKVKSSKVMAVVKADAYGHGMIECVRALKTLGDKKPDYYAVALLEEALELRKAGIKDPVLVFAPVLEDEAAAYLKYNILPTVFSSDHIDYLKKAGKNKKIKVHVKIDTGMGRLGITHNLAPDFIKKIAAENIVVDGLYTHFATSDELDKTYAQIQLQRFREILEVLKADGVNYGLAHCANSGAILDMPESYLDMVRPGIALYGYYPSMETSGSIKLKPVMSIISHITNIKEIEAGGSVSYGRKFIAPFRTRIATVSVGYADGYARGLSNKAEVIIRGKRFEQIGQVCMDRIMINLGKENNIKENDRVVLLGKDKKNEIDAWEWAKALNTIPYEITCNISKRVPRFYIE